MHARGMEQHAHGVNNCLASINIVLASGRIGRPGCGYSTITGQGNGQGGREHGQKRVERGEIHCPCHVGSFDLANGRPLAGPPRRPLPRIALEVRRGVIYATGVEERTT